MPRHDDEARYFFIEANTMVQTELLQKAKQNSGFVAAQAKRVHVALCYSKSKTLSLFAAFGNVACFSTHPACCLTRARRELGWVMLFFPVELCFDLVLLFFEPLLQVRKTGEKSRITWDGE